MIETALTIIAAVAGSFLAGWLAARRLGRADQRLMQQQIIGLLGRHDDGHGVQRPTIHASLGLSGEGADGTRRALRSTTSSWGASSGTTRTSRATTTPSRRDADEALEALADQGLITYAEDAVPRCYWLTYTGQLAAIRLAQEAERDDDEYYRRIGQNGV